LSPVAKKDGTSLPPEWLQQTNCQQGNGEISPTVAIQFEMKGEFISLAKKARSKHVDGMHWQRGDPQALKINWRRTHKASARRESCKYAFGYTIGQAQ